jgi:L-alanine-DL-glutamate epimerase-like enolase superfamily enzyme
MKQDFGLLMFLYVYMNEGIAGWGRVHPHIRTVSRACGRRRR